MVLSTSFRILFRAARQFGADGASQMGAALANYALFSTAPLLLLAGKTLISLYLAYTSTASAMGPLAPWLPSWSGCIIRRRLLSSGRSWSRPVESVPSGFPSRGAEAFP
jgi:uncharacterized BrkB/YihY/UPF0761 family membrane protein